MVIAGCRSQPNKNTAFLARFVGVPDAFHDQGSNGDEVWEKKMILRDQGKRKDPFPLKK
jgi:hypothetical protein